MLDRPLTLYVGREVEIGQICGIRVILSDLMPPDALLLIAKGDVSPTWLANVTGFPAAESPGAHSDPCTTSGQGSEASRSTASPAG